MRTKAGVGGGGILFLMIRGREDLTRGGGGGGRGTLWGGAGPCMALQPEGLGATDGQPKFLKGHPGCRVGSGG